MRSLIWWIKPIFKNVWLWTYLRILIDLISRIIFRDSRLFWALIFLINNFKVYFMFLNALFLFSLIHFQIIVILNLLNFLSRTKCRSQFLFSKVNLIFYFILIIIFSLYFLFLFNFFNSPFLDHINISISIFWIIKRVNNTLMAILWILKCQFILQFTSFSIIRSKILMNIFILKLLLWCSLCDSFILTLNIFLCNLVLMKIIFWVCFWMWIY